MDSIIPEKNNQNDSENEGDELGLEEDKNPNMLEDIEIEM